ncbi:MAG: hypothetical protein H2184_00910 [Candidatus Galacturonibacter soehngenii]|nr:hypothetical protein [Candidatus Galacturonibacter soehngenii]
MERDIYKQILLKKMKKLQKAKYVIYGTKDVALIYYDEVIRKFGEDSIAFFIDGKKESDYFKGKPVFKCDEIVDKNVNDYKYIIGSVSKIPFLSNNLKKMGVKQDSIIDTINHFSADYLEENIDNIQNIFLYPPIESKTILEEIIKELDNYIIVSHKSKQSVKIYTNFNIEIALPNGYELCNEKVQLSQSKEKDIVLVWEAERLIDRELENVENVFCFDNKFIVHLGPKILTAVMTKFMQTKSEEYYKELSKSHFSDLIDKCKNFDNAIVCGGGPSLNDLDKKYGELLKNSCIVVCNGFHNLEKTLNIIPTVYCVEDYDYLSGKLREQMDRIVDYVIRNKVYLCVKLRWVAVCCARYPQLEDLIIGIDVTEHDVIPSVENLLHTTSDNVVTSMCAPVASGLTNNVYFVGCDGVKNGEWWHADKSKPERELHKYTDVFLQPKYCEDIMEYIKTLNLLYKRFLEYGESKGKKYYLLTHSTIEELEKRYFEFIEDKNT